MTMSRSAARPQRRRARFLPPAAGGAQKTGWEALDKWVGSGDAAPAAAAPAEGGAKKTGWEALDKWVGSGDAAAASPGAPAGAPAESTVVVEETVVVASGSGGGFVAWIKRVFGGG